MILASQVHLRQAELCTIVQHVVIMHAMLKAGTFFDRSIGAVA